MAALSSSSSIYPLHGRLEREITCAACNGYYEKPKLLPCNHYFCEGCIENLAKKASGTPFACPYPKCGKETALPSGGAAQLDNALLRFVERKIKVYSVLAGAAGKAKAVCRQCTEGAVAKAFCNSCADFVCADCEASHGKLTVFAGHKLVSLAELKNREPKDIPLKETPLPQCADHDKPMEMFCFQCNSLICHICFSYDHHTHQTETNVLKKCASEARDGVRKALVPLQALHTNISDATKALTDLEAKVIAHKTELCQSIKHSFDQIKEDLDQRKDELITTARKLSRTKENDIRHQREGLHAAQQEIDSLTKLVEHNLEGAENQHLMSTHAKLQAMVEEALARHCQLELAPTTSDDIICTPPTGDSIPRELGAVFLSSERSGIHVAVPKLCRVGESAQFTVRVPQSMGTNVHVQLKSLVKPLCFIEACILPSTGRDTYSITYTPQVRGRHQLMVKVNGKEIHGSPFNVFVNIDPNLLGGPEKIITGLNQPWGVAFISSDNENEQQLVVTETGGKKVTIMKRNGERVRAIECGDLHGLRGVAVGSESNIYVVDKSSKSLYKFSRNGKRKGTVGGFDSPTFIEVYQNQIHVPENGSNEIKIVDTDLRNVRIIHPTTGSRNFSISLGASPCPKGIAENDGKLFVCVGKQKGVYKYDLENTPISHIRVKGLSKSESPKGICFDANDHLFMVMTGKKSQGVYVYRSDGEFVTSFGFDHFESAAGIAIDEDGFVYVCDFAREGKIVVF